MIADGFSSQNAISRHRKYNLAIFKKIDFFDVLAIPISRDRLKH